MAAKKAAVAANGKVKQDKAKPIKGLKYGVGKDKLSVPGKGLSNGVIKASWERYSFIQAADEAPEERIGWYAVKYADEFLRIQTVTVHESELVEAGV
jgi:hypothetical protein